MSYIFPFQNIKQNVLFEFLFRQLMTSRTFTIYLQSPFKAMAEKEGRTEIQKLEYLKNEKSFLDEIKKHFSQLLKC